MDSDEEDLDALEALAANVDVGEEDLGNLKKRNVQFQINFFDR